MLKLFQPIKGLLAAHTLYAVGGAVRAHISKQQATEADFATPSLPAEILASATALGLPTHTRGLPFGSVQVAGCDITTFRTETYAASSRYPTVNFTPDLLADAARRDFTCNAVYLAPNGALTDPYGGATHWQEGQVIWLGDPAIKLAEDPLRWWRWLRFAATVGPASLLHPQAVLVPRGPSHRYDFTQLAAWAAAGQGTVSAALRAREAEKFKAQIHAAEIRSVVAELLANRPELAQKLLP